MSKEDAAVTEAEMKEALETARWVLEDPMRNDYARETLLARALLTAAKELPAPTSE